MWKSIVIFYFSPLEVGWTFIIHIFMYFEHVKTNLSMSKTLMPRNLSFQMRKLLWGLIAAIWNENTVGVSHIKCSAWSWQFSMSHYYMHNNMMSWNDRMPASHQKLKQQRLISSKDNNYAQWLWEMKACATQEKGHTNGNISEPSWLGNRPASLVFSSATRPSKLSEIPHHG